ncbi:MAG TPA: hypothetical protein VGC42_32310 [Kofleriaceae bacterium]
MANRKATFAKRQRETELKDKAKAKDDRRAQKRGETPRDAKGPQIAWDEAVQAVTSDEDAVAAGDLPSLRTGNQDQQQASSAAEEDLRANDYRGSNDNAAPSGPASSGSAPSSSAPQASPPAGATSTPPRR